MEEGKSEEVEEKIDERAAWRNLRRRRRLDTEETEEATKIVVAKREATERKRKGKQIATSIKKRELRQSSKNIIIQEPITDLTRSPYCQAEEEEEEQAKDVMDTIESEGVYEKLRVTIDQKLLEAMVYFRDPKKRKECAGRGHQEKRAIGFEWLLEHSLVEVPVNLAREFFTSFHFYHTTDLDAVSIRFRVFNQEMMMTLKEWSLSVGLLSQEDDEAEAWAEREIGHPEDRDGLTQMHHGG